MREDGCESPREPLEHTPARRRSNAEHTCKSTATSLHTRSNHFHIDHPITPHVHGSLTRVLEHSRSLVRAWCIGGARGDHVRGPRYTTVALLVGVMFNPRSHSPSLPASSASSHPLPMSRLVRTRPDGRDTGVIARCRYAHVTRRNGYTQYYAYYVIGWILGDAR